jgi:hypothetical protein
VREAGRILGVVWALAAVLAAGGCRFQQHREHLSVLHAQGNYEAAEQLLEDDATRAMYGARSRSLWYMDRGAVALALGDLEGAVSYLEQAELLNDRLHSAALESLTAWTINDAASEYIAEPYEDMYVNVLKLLAHLQSGWIIGGATVEARRLYRKADLLRDRYVQYRERVADRDLPDPQSGPLVRVNEAGQFIESPLGTFLTAVTFMASGEHELQRVAGRRLLDSIRLQTGLIGPVQEEPFEGVGELRPGDANLLVVALAGRGPTKRAERLGPILIGTAPIYIEIPVLEANISRVGRVEVELSGGERRSLPLIEDMNAVALENHRRQMPLIYWRTLIRAAGKTTASVLATDAARRTVSESDRGWVTLVGVIGGLVAVTATERADVRSWTFLPGQAHVGLLALPPGEHRLRVLYQTGAGGAVHASDWRTVEVTEEGLTTIVTHYWD